MKSKEIDSKLKKLEETPTVNTKSVYSLNPPGFRIGIPDPPKVYYPDVDGNWPEGIPGTPGENEYIRPGGYWSGGSDWDETFSPDFSQEYLKNDPTGRSTEGLIKPDGTVMTELPPGGESFILGPLVDGFVPNHTYDAYTNIGYLQKDTRQFVLLARISGIWKDGIHGSSGSYQVWNGTSTGLTIYNQNFTLEMAQWMQSKINEGKWINNVPYFYSGGVPQRPQDPADCPFCPPGMYGGFGFGAGGLFGALQNLIKYGIGGNPSLGTKQEDPRSGDSADANLFGLFNIGNTPKRTVAKKSVEGGIKIKTMYHGTSKSAEQGIRQTGFRTTKTGLSPNKVWVGDKPVAQKYAQGGYSSGSMAKNPSQQQSIMKVRIPKGSGVTVPGPFGKETAISKRTADVGAGLKPQRVSSGAKAGTTVRVTGVGGGSASHMIQTIEPWIGKTDPLQGYTYDTKSGKYKLANSYDYEYSDRTKQILREIKKPYEVPKIEEQKYKFNFSGKYTPQNTPDKTASSKSDELVASGNARGQRWRTMDKYWQGYETTERMNVIYDRVGHGDQAWEKIVDEARIKNGWRNREIQEHLNIIAHEKVMIRENPNYVSPFVVVETIKVEDAKTTQPFLDRSNYYTKLDPQSSEAMPGGKGYDPNIDSDTTFKRVMKKARTKRSNK